VRGEKKERIYSINKTIT